MSGRRDKTGEEGQPELLHHAGSWTARLPSGEAVADDPGMSERIRHGSTIHGPRDGWILQKECHTLADAGDDVHPAVADPPALDGVPRHAIRWDEHRPWHRRVPARPVDAAPAGGTH